MWMRYRCRWRPRRRRASARLTSNALRIPWDAVGRNATTLDTRAVSRVVRTGTMCRESSAAGPESSSHRGGHGIEAHIAHLERPGQEGYMTGWPDASPPPSAQKVHTTSRHWSAQGGMIQHEPASSAGLLLRRREPIAWPDERRDACRPGGRKYSTTAARPRRSSAGPRQWHDEAALRRRAQI